MSSLLLDSEAHYFLIIETHYSKVEKNGLRKAHFAEKMATLLRLLLLCCSGYKDGNFCSCSWAVSGRQPPELWNEKME